MDTHRFEYIKLSLVSCNPKLAQCAEKDEKADMKRYFRILMPEAIVNFKKSEHEDAVEYTLSGNYAMQIDKVN